MLEVDPDNPEARKQIGQVVTAVRQFDTTIPGRRWANGLPPRLPKPQLAWWHWLIIVGVVIAAFAGGFGFAHLPPPEAVSPDPAKPELPEPPKVPDDHPDGESARKGRRGEA